MNGGSMLNDFLLNLLALQQDGKHAISAPAEWITRAPVLAVPTDLDGVIDGIARTLLKGNGENEVARWHFIIGSPGNGKSAAMGRLCRLLHREYSCAIIDDRGVAIEDLEPTAVPYDLRVLEKPNRYASAMIVQDASVVRSPFASNVDPARELVATLEEAWDRGISLVVCTNRGVIEKAYYERYLDPAVNTRPWFKILKSLVETARVTLCGEIGGFWTFDRRERVFQGATVTYSCLDSHSLLLGSSVFENLVLEATLERSWSVCSGCSLSQLCPFKANRDWLANEEARHAFLRVLRRAEVLSGQVIVFREAVALLSLILAGCPRDYGMTHPCQWVKERVEANDLFAIAQRRIYMTVFASSCRYGMEISPTLVDRQVKGLSILGCVAQSLGLDFGRPLIHVLKGAPPSTDVGVGRLIGAGGVLTEIDPSRECLPADFLEEWDGDLSVTASCQHPLFTEIERRCIKIWVDLEGVIESAPLSDAPLCYWALRRWSSNFLVHFGGLLQGRTAWARELDDFIEILEILKKDPSHRSTEEKRRLVELNQEIENLLAASTDSENRTNAIPLSESVTLSGRWVTERLRPRIRGNAGGLSIAVQFHGGEVASLDARTFVMLSRHLHWGLDARCLPKQILMGMIDARARAASKHPSDEDPAYAFANDDVELAITTGGKEVFTLLRVDGDVHVERKH